MAADREHLVITRGDWSKTLEFMSGPFLEDLEDQQPVEDQITERDHPELIKRLRGIPPDSWLPLIRAYVLERINHVMREATDRALDETVPVWDLGMDSMMTIELRNQLTTGGVRLKIARMIGGPSIDQISRMAYSELVKDSRLKAGPVAASKAIATLEGAEIDPAVSGEELGEEEAPLGPVVSHLAAAFGGAVVMGIISFIAWQFLVQGAVP